MNDKDQEKDISQISDISLLMTAVNDIAIYLMHKDSNFCSVINEAKGIHNEFEESFRAKIQKDIEDLHRKLNELLEK
jgi:hypothetical protein